MKKIDVKKDFPFFEKNNDVIYIDSGLTTLKPQVVIDSMNDSLSNTIPTLGGSETPLMEQNYDKTDEAIILQARLINSKTTEVFFTPGATVSLNMVATIVMEDFKKGDKIILGNLEHASNYLPWKKIAEDKGIEVLHYNLTKDLVIDTDHLGTILDDSVKLIALAHTFNTVATTNDVKRVKEVVGKDVFVFVDAIQSVGKQVVDVKDMDIDGLIYTGHKMMAPTGISVVYLKEEHINSLKPAYYGGKMINTFSTGSMQVRSGKDKFKAGSPNFASMVAMGEAVKYILDLGVENIHSHTIELANYLKQRLGELENIKIYNKDQQTANVLFAVKGTLGEDVAYTLAKNNKIYLRPGISCISEDNPVFKGTRGIRASFYVYNNIEDVDRLIEALIDGGDFTDVLFTPRQGRSC